MATARAWSLNHYGGTLFLNRSVNVPVVRRPTDLLIRVRAASLNNIDDRIINGYGHSALDLLSHFDHQNISEVLCEAPSSRLPFVPGRDFSGEVLDVGVSVRKFAPGDVVYGTVAPHRDGTLSDYIVANEDSIGLKPTGLTHAEAASLPYVAMTVCGSLGAIRPGDRYLIQGASGGIGSFAIQYVSARGGIVTAVSNKDSFDFCMSMGAAVCIDYEMVERGLEDLPQHDVALQTVHGVQLPVHAVKEGGDYITIAPPLLSNMDSSGVILGSCVSIADYSSTAYKFYRENGVYYKWGLYNANSDVLDRLANLIEEGKLKPVIHKQFTMSAVLEAFEYFRTESVRGKLVINLDDI